MPTASLITAASFAAEKHKNQRRKDAAASPYINHPLALASVLAVECGISDTTTICAALLHDTIEDTETTAQELENLFGERVTNVVLEVTDDKSLEKPARKQEQIRRASGLSPEAKRIKLADKICNLRDILATPPANWTNQRKQEYFEWAAQVVSALRGANQELEALFDEVYAQRTQFAAAD